MEETPNQNTTQNISNSADETKSSKAGIAIIALAVLALCGIGFGVYEFVQNNDLQTKNNELQNTIKEYESSSSLKDEDKETDADIADSVNVDEEVSDNYLEIPEWGIKIKMPNNFVMTSSRMVTDTLSSSFIEFNGYFSDSSKEYTNIPEGFLGTFWKTTEKPSEFEREQFGDIVAEFDNVYYLFRPSSDMRAYTDGDAERIVRYMDNFSSYIFSL